MKPFLTICTILPSNTAVSPELYTKLYFLHKKLQVNSEGIFADSVTKSPQQMNAVEQNVCKKKMMVVAEKMGIKIDKLMKNDPAREFLEGIAKLFHKKNLLTLNTSSDMLESLLKSVPSFKGRSMEDDVIGFREVVGMVRDKDVLLLDALIAMRDEYVHFSTRCLKATCGYLCQMWTAKGSSPHTLWF